MNDDSEALQRKLLKLLQDLIPTATIADAAAVSQGLGDVEDNGANADGSPSSSFPSNPSPPQDASSLASGHHESETMFPQRESLLELGEIPAVQDRFYSLLKNRLQAEIQRKPPLFPWETEIHDYETEAIPFAVPHFSQAVSDAETAKTPKVPALAWGSQLKNLNLPVPMPEKVLAQLFERCQEVMQSSLLEGAKLVRAVEELFPGQSQALNHLAGLVIAAPARSGGSATADSGTHYPPSYDAAAAPQQMVLSLLAAREIMAALTLTLSTSQPHLERQWLTEAGALSLAVQYTTSKLQIRGELPSGGSLLLRGNGLQSTADRLTAGLLTVELNDVQVNQPYTLEVRFTEDEESSLTFAVRVIE